MGSQRVGLDWVTKYFHFFKWFTTYFLKQKWPQKPRAKSVPRKFSKELRNISYQLHSNDPKKVHTSEKGRIKNGSGNLGASKPVRMSFSWRWMFFICDGGGGALGQDLQPPHPPPRGSFQLPCPLHPSSCLYIVSQFDQAEWNSVLGSVQLWNHLEPLKKTCSAAALEIWV